MSTQRALFKKKKKKSPILIKKKKKHSKATQKPLANRSQIPVPGAAQAKLLAQLSPSFLLSNLCQSPQPTAGGQRPPDSPVSVPFRSLGLHTWKAENGLQWLPLLSTPSFS